MATFTADAEEGTAGATLTVGKWAVITGAVTYQLAAALMGNLGYRFAVAGTAAVNVWSNVLVTTTGSQAERFRFYINVSSRPTSGTAMILQTTAPNGSNLVNVSMNTAGQLIVNAQSSVAFTSTFVVPLNTWVRIELVCSQGGGTTTTGIIGFGAIAGSAALTTTNSASQAYFYATNLAVGGTAGFGNFKVGKVDATSSWTGNIYIDNFAGDNSTNAAKTWTSAPSTWLGPGPSSVSAVWAAVSTAGFTIAGRKDISAPTLTAAAAGSLSVAGSVFALQSSVLSMSAIPSLAVAPDVNERAVLSMLGGSSFSVAGTKALSAVLAAAAAGTLVVGPVRTQFSVLSMDAGPPGMVIGTVRSQFAVLPMNGIGLFSPIPNPGQSIPITLAATAALSIAGSKAMSAGLVLAGAGAMALAGSQALSAVLALRGVPVLTLAPLASRSIVWAARGTPALTLAPLRTALAVWSARGTPTFVILARVIGDIHPYDNVLAFVIPDQKLAILLPYRKAARLLDNGASIVRVFDNSVQAVPLPGGMLAVIQD